MNKKFEPVLYSQPFFVERLAALNRAEILPKIESGVVAHLDFVARVFGTGKMNAPYQFNDAELSEFAASFSGQPFLRNHDQYDIAARDGTIIASELDAGEFKQTIRLTTREGMLNYVEGRIDRFSIGWDAERMTCSICGMDYLGGECAHIAGRKYEIVTGNQTALIVFHNPRGIETSAVNVPAVEGTHIEAQLQALKSALLEKKQSESTATQEQELDPLADKAQHEATIERLAQVRLNYLEVATRALRQLPRGDTVNIREKIAARAAKLDRAKELTELADNEGRNLNDEERAEFEGCLSEADALAAEVTQFNDDRAKLRAALELEISAPATPKAEKNEPATDPKRKTRAEFDALSAAEKSAFVKVGGKIE